MKNLKFLFIILGFMSLYMTGCGGSSSKTASAGACGSGYIYSQQYGCVESAGCPAGQGWIGGTCMPIGGGMGSCQGSCGPGMVQTQMGCLPQDACPACYGHSGPLCYISTNYGSMGGMGGGYPGYPY